MLSTHGPKRHVILTPGGATLPALKLARRLTKVLPEPAHDLAQKLRYGGGWVARGITLRDAERVQGILAEFGCDSRQFPGDGAIEPPPVSRVKSVRFTEETLRLSMQRGEEEVSPKEIACIDLMLIGALEEVDRAEEDPVRRWAEPLLVDLPFARQREALLHYDQSQLQPTLFIALAGPVEFLKVESGTPFPDYAASGGHTALANFLAFVSELLGKLPKSRVLPEAQRFWESGEVESILRKAEEVQKRLSWLAEILARELWEGFL